MGLFEDTIRAGLESPEGRRGWLEAEQELATYYASVAASIVSAPENVSLGSTTAALGEFVSKPSFDSQPIMWDARAVGNQVRVPAQVERPGPAWKITMILADFAQTYDGKLCILGGGWSIKFATPLTPTAIALKFDVPWDETNRPHRIIIALVTSDGQAVTVPGPVGPQAMRIEAQLEVGRPPGLAAGTSLDASLAVNVPPIPLAPGRYEWRCTVGENVAYESCAFTVRNTQPQAGPQVAG